MACQAFCVKICVPSTELKHSPRSRHDQEKMSQGSRQRPRPLKSGLGTDLETKTNLEYDSTSCDFIWNFV